jgi:hypothetical protein
VADDEAEADDRPVEELGLVQLAARLGASIERRRAWLAERQNAVHRHPVAPFADAEDFEAAGAEDAARAIADFFGPASAGQREAGEAATAGHAVVEPEVPPPFAEPTGASVPSALRDLPLEQEDDVDEADLSASFSLPLSGKFAEPSELSGEGEDAEYDEVESDEGEYSSLLAMKNPFLREQEFVRVEEPEDESGLVEPTVTFPSSTATAIRGADSVGRAARPFDPPKKPGESALSQAPAAAPRDPDDVERSLRDALATLQRMSGAA